MAASKNFMFPFFAFFSLLLLLLFLTHNLSSDYCTWRSVGRHRCISGTLPVFQPLQSRKMLEEMKKEMEEEVVGGRKKRQAPVDWEDQLRRVPSGPDPLHHNGGSPKKPRTP